MWNWLKKSKPKPSPEDVYAGLRNQIFSLKPADIGVVPNPKMPDVWGVLMEFARPNAVVSLVSLADGTTSLYFSNGGGVIGAGGDASVADATASFIALAQQFLPQMTPTTSFPPPPINKVRFYLLTFSGVVTAEADEPDLGNGGHHMSPLFHKGHEVIAYVRMSTESQRQ